MPETSKSEIGLGRHVRSDRGMDFYRPLSDNALFRELAFVCRQLNLIEHEVRRRRLLEQDFRDRLASR